MRPDFIAHPYGAIIAIALLDEYRAAKAKPVTLAGWHRPDDEPTPAAPAAVPAPQMWV